MKIILFNFVSLLSFLINPIIGFICILIGLYKSRKSYFLCFLYSLFVAISISKNEIYADSLAYQNMYNNVTLDDLSQIDGYITYKIISYFFKDIGIPYEVLPFLHVFFLIIFLTKSLIFLNQRYSFTGDKFIFSLIGLTILANPIVASMGQRNSLAIFIVIYAVILFFRKKTYLSFFYLVLASLIHFVMFIFIPILIVSKLVNFNKLNYLFSAFLAIIFSFFYEKISSIFFINDGITDFATKYNEFQYDLGGGGVLVYNVVLYAMKLIFYFVFLNYAFVRTEDIFLNNFKNFILMVTISCFLFIQNPIAFGRFTTYLIFMIFIYIISYSSLKYVSIYTKITLFAFCIIYFLFYNIFPWKDAIFGGDIHLALLLPSFYTIWDLFQ